MTDKAPAPIPDFPWHEMVAEASKRADEIVKMSETMRLPLSSAPMEWPLAFQAALATILAEALSLLVTAELSRIALDQQARKPGLWKPSGGGRLS